MAIYKWLPWINFGVIVATAVVGIVKALLAALKKN